MASNLPRSAVNLIAVVAIVGCSPYGKEEIASQSASASRSKPPIVPKSPPSKPVATHENSAAPSGDSLSKTAVTPTLDDLLLFYPSKYPQGDWQPQGVNFEDVWFKAKDGTQLHGWYCPCENPRAVILFAHGNAGNLSQRSGLMRYFQTQLRVTAFIFDYRGYGRSEGVPMVEGIMQDARAARALLAHLAAVPESQIVLMGRSLGGAVVVQLAAESPARALVLESTFSSFRDVAAHHYPRLAWLVPKSKLDSVSQIERYLGPLLQSHGDADSTVPYSLGLRLFAAAKGPKWWITIVGGDHNDPQSDDYYRHLNRFLDDL